jgi:DNA-binding response OmpR family regulator
MHARDHILVIDDEPTIATLLVAILHDAGYGAATVAHDGDVVVALCCPPPALILLGTGKPGIGDTPLINQVQTTILATTALVVMSTAPRYAAPLPMPGAREYLHKPFAVAELLTCVARYARPAQSAERSVGYA